MPYAKTVAWRNAAQAASSAGWVVDMAKTDTATQIRYAKQTAAFAAGAALSTINERRWQLKKIIDATLYADRRPARRSGRL